MNCNLSVTFIKSLNQSSIKPCQIVSNLLLKVLSSLCKKVKTRFHFLVLVSETRGGKEKFRGEEAHFNLQINASLSSFWVKSDDNVQKRT